MKDTPIVNALVELGRSLATNNHSGVVRLSVEPRLFLALAGELERHRVYEGFLDGDIRNPVLTFTTPYGITFKVTE